ncbi:MAG: hypothetical protein IKP24_00295 [Alphaproteobacteria bacterium]|nr:hypothetical protein [Alphaproteobacteria bacterium]
MKRLANPKWALLLENISREERGDIFMAVLKYPDAECSSAVWPFIKAELDEDDIKYKAKCERLATNRLARWGEQNSSDIKQTLSEIGQKSDAIANSKTNNTNTIEQSKAIQSRANDMLQKLSNSFSPLRTPKYHIDNEFSLPEIIKRNTDLFPLFKEFTPEQLEKGQMSLIRKCMGQDKTMAQIIGWIKHEGKFT